MTGRYPFRMMLVRGPLLEPNRPTLPSVLKQAGYKTAMIGKWHLGVEHEKNPAANQQLGGGPVDHGFDHFYGIPASLDIPPYYWIHNDRPLAPPSEKISDNNTPGWTRIQGAFWRGGGIAPGYKHIDVLPIIRDRSADYIEAAAKSDIPFSYTSPCPRRTRRGCRPSVRGQNSGQRLRRLRADGRRPRRPPAWRARQNQAGR